MRMRALRAWKFHLMPSKWLLSWITFDTDVIWNSQRPDTLEERLKLPQTFLK